MGMKKKNKRGRPRKTCLQQIGELARARKKTMEEW